MRRKKIRICTDALRFRMLHVMPCARSRGESSDQKGNKIIILSIETINLNNIEVCFLQICPISFQHELSRMRTKIRIIFIEEIYSIECVSNYDYIVYVELCCRFMYLWLEKFGNK